MTRTEFGVDTQFADPAHDDLGDFPRTVSNHRRTWLPAIGARTRWPASPSRPLNLALALLSLAALLCGSVELAFAEHRGDWYYASMVVGAWVYVAAGALAWSRRPSNGLGCLIMVGGLVLLISNLDVTGLSALAAVSQIFATTSLTIVVHILLAFPAGRLSSTASRVTVFAGYVVCFVLQAPLYLFASAPAPYGLLTIDDRPDLVAAGRWVQTVSGALVMTATIVVLADRLRRADPRRRRSLAPLYGYGILAVLFIPLAPNVIGPALGLSVTTVFTMQLVDLVGVPVAFVLSLLRGGFARTGEIQELAAWLSSADVGRIPLTAAMKQALGDDSLRLLFWSSELGSYVDEDGKRIDDAGSAGREVVDITASGQRIGAIDYDPTLNADPDVVRSAGRVVAVALDRERVSAELRASQRDLRRSRVRIVEAGDAERRRIARDLHDGLQVRLVLLAMEAQHIADDDAAFPRAREAALALRVGIDAAAAESRGLVHAVLPASLIEGGLSAATEDLVDHVPVPTRLTMSLGDVPLPAVVESTAYFVIAEALGNALKHASPNALTVLLTRTADLIHVEVTDDGVGGASVGGGSGLRGLKDRVDAVGG
ncbi:MAG TPA: histidine kinase, partial [Nocardioidaceae bacterium]|nr:histidine kinase [Nocardioidaceae bacterium]